MASKIRRGKLAKFVRSSVARNTSSAIQKFEEYVATSLFHAKTIIPVETFGQGGILVLREFNRLMRDHNKIASKTLELYPESIPGYAKLITDIEMTISGPHFNCKELQMLYHMESTTSFSAKGFQAVLWEYIAELCLAFGFTLLTLRLFMDMQVFPVVTQYMGRHPTPIIISLVADCIRNTFRTDKRSSSPCPLHVLLPESNPYFWCAIPGSILVEEWNKYDTLQSSSEAPGCRTYGVICEGVSAIITSTFEQIAATRTASCLSKYVTSTDIIHFVMKHAGINYDANVISDVCELKYLESTQLADNLKLVRSFLDLSCGIGSIPAFYVSVVVAKVMVYHQTNKLDGIALVRIIESLVDAVWACDNVYLPTYICRLNILSELLPLIRTVEILRAYAPLGDLQHYSVPELNVLCCDQFLLWNDERWNKTTSENSVPRYHPDSELQRMIQLRKTRRFRYVVFNPPTASRKESTYPFLEIDRHAELLEMLGKAPLYHYFLLFGASFLVAPEGKLVCITCSHWTSSSAKEGKVLRHALVEKLDMEKFFFFPKKLCITPESDSVIMFANGKNPESSNNSVVFIYPISTVDITLERLAYLKEIDEALLNCDSGTPNQYFQIGKVPLYQLNQEHFTRFQTCTSQAYDLIKNSMVRFPHNLSDFFEIRFGVEPGLKFVQTLATPDAMILFQNSPLYQKYSRHLIDERDNNPYASPAKTYNVLLEVPWDAHAELSKNPDDPVTRYLRTAYNLLEPEFCAQMRLQRSDDMINNYLLDLFERRHMKPKKNRLAIRAEAQNKFPNYITLKKTIKPNHIQSRYPYIFTKQYISPNKCHEQRWVAFGINLLPRIVGHSSLYLAPRISSKIRATSNEALLNEDPEHALVWATLGFLNSIVIECYLRIYHPVRRHEKLYNVTTSNLNPISFPLPMDIPTIHRLASMSRQIYNAKLRLTDYDILFRSKLVHLAQFQGPPCKCELPNSSANNAHRPECGHYGADPMISWFWLVNLIDAEELLKFEFREYELPFAVGNSKVEQVQNSINHLLSESAILQYQIDQEAYFIYGFSKLDQLNVEQSLGIHPQTCVRDAIAKGTIADRVDGNLWWPWVQKENADFPWVFDNVDENVDIKFFGSLLKSQDLRFYPSDTDLFVAVAVAIGFSSSPDTMRKEVLTLLGNAEHQDYSNIDPEEAISLCHSMDKLKLIKALSDATGYTIDVFAVDSAVQTSDHESLKMCWTSVCEIGSAQILLKDRISLFVIAPNKFQCIVLGETEWNEKKNSLKSLSPDSITKYNISMGQTESAPHLITVLGFKEDQAAENARSHPTKRARSKSKRTEKPEKSTKQKKKKSGKKSAATEVETPQNADLVANNSAGVVEPNRRPQRETKRPKNYKYNSSDSLTDDEEYAIVEELC